MDLSAHLDHLFHFDGILHWCFLIAVFGFWMGLIWVVVRILLPLRRLAKQAADLLDGQLPAFDEPIRGIGEIDQLRCSLQYMMGQIQSAQERENAYRHALMEIQENERKRIAREIHDDTIQSLVLVAHHIERAAQMTEAVDSDTHIYLKNARSQIVLTVDNLRQMIANLRPTALDELGLVVAIEMLCEGYRNIEFSVMGHVYQIEHMQELAIFRAAQEAINNAEQHAGARHITVKLSYTASTVTLEVCDDGAGFQIPQQLQEFAVRGHYGLLGIRERMLDLGGQLHLTSELTLGTRVSVTVPALRTGLLAA
jgi:signal transduction histidine kinase